MSKNLEKEYNEMIRSELPDLWDRISAALPEKKIDAESDVLVSKKSDDAENSTFVSEKKIEAESDLLVSEKKIEAESNVLVSEKNDDAENTAFESKKTTVIEPDEFKPQEKKHKTKIYRFAGIAAACVCAAVIIPVAVITLRTNQSRSAAVEYQTADAAIGMTAEEAADENYETSSIASKTTNALKAASTNDISVTIAPEDNKGVSGGAYDEAEADSESISAGNAAEAAESYAATAEAFEVEEAAAPAAEEAAAEAEDSAKEKASDGTRNYFAPEYFYEVKLEITKRLTADELAHEAGITDSGDFAYEARVIDSDDLASGTIICLIVDEDTPGEYQKELASGQYTFDLAGEDMDADPPVFIIR